MLAKCKNDASKDIERAMKVASEVGGRANKFNNRYEYRWVAKQLLRLSTEKISSLVHEPVGDLSDGIDLLVVKGEKIELHQCKGSNGHKNHWTFGDLNFHKLFIRAKTHLAKGDTYKYKLVSPFPCKAMTELTRRAQNSNDSPDIFYDNQIKEKSGTNSRKIETYFKDFCSYMGLMPLDDNNINIARSYLKRIEFVFFGDSEDSVQSIIENISDIYSGDPKGIYETLIAYTIENNRLGSNITISEINEYLAQRKIYKLNLSNNMVWPCIDKLNKEFEESFKPMDTGLICREEVEQIFQFSKQGISIVIHGKAGKGKSGCVQGIVEKYKNEKVPYLALKLDRRTPSDTAKKYGESMGLPASPVTCLARISKNVGCVLILDQLDAIRWTTQNSRTALEVCKEMIRQAENINREGNGNQISIIFVCRTIDIETDSGIKFLFQSDKDDDAKIEWNKVEIGDLSEKIVKDITGKAFEAFTPRFIEFLKTINNLAIWCRLDENRKNIQYASAFAMIKDYWEQFQEEAENIGIPNSEIVFLKLSLMNAMISQSTLTIRESKIGNCSLRARKFALSKGIIVKANSDKLISFVHQSFFDVFCVEVMYDKIDEGIPIGEVLVEAGEQNPALRYRLQMLLQAIAENSQQQLVKCGEALLEDNEVRYYMKYALWEVISQLIKVDECLFDFITAKIDTDWCLAITDTVITGHPIYVNRFMMSGHILSWIKSECMRHRALSILGSVKTVMGDEITELLRILSINDDELAWDIYSMVLRWNMLEDTDAMFDFRLDLLKNHPNLQKRNLNHYGLVENNFERTGRLLALLLELKEGFPKENRGYYLDKKGIFEQLGTHLSEYLMDVLLPIVERKTVPKNGFEGHLHTAGWASTRENFTMGRGIVKMIITAGSVLAKNNPNKYMGHLKKYANSLSPIVNEIFLYTLIDVPTEYADTIVEWLISDNCSHMFENTGSYEKNLDASKLLIEKYSHFCSDITFTKLESAITYFHEKNCVERLKWRIDRNRDMATTGKSMSYYPFWGELQAYLLPALDITRTSDHTKQLIPVLKRRFAGYDLCPKTGRVESGWVRSSIPSDVSLKFTDKQWIRLIKDKKLSDPEFLYSRHFRSSRFGESSHDDFSRLYEQAGSFNPERFVSLAYKFPSYVDRHYVQAVWRISALCEPPKDASSDWQPAKFETISRIFNLLCDHAEINELNMCHSFCWMVRSRADEKWPNDVINRIIELALFYVESEYDFPKHDDTELGTHSLNHVRGAAVHALSKLLWADNTRYDKLKPVIDSLVSDINPSVRYASIEAVVAVFNFDKEQFEKWFFTLVKSDERIARSHRGREMLFTLWLKHKSECNEIIKNLFYSEDEESSENGAFIASNLYIVYDENTEIFRDMLLCGKLTASQIKGCSTVAVSLMEESSHRDKAKEVIEILLAYGEIVKENIDRLFYRSSFIFPQDIDLVKRIVSLDLYGFFPLLEYYIEKSGVPVLELSDIIFHMCKVCTSADSKNGIQYHVATKLPLLVALLYDQANTSKELRNICLNMWDILYKHNISDTRILTKQMTNI